MIKTYTAEVQVIKFDGQLTTALEIINEFKIENFSVNKKDYPTGSCTFDIDSCKIKDGNYVIKTDKGTHDMSETLFKSLFKEKK